MGENIGAAARVMHNFALSDLRIVAPRDGWPNPQAEAMASGAKALIDNAKLYSSLEEALADIQVAYAVTARLRDMEKPILTPAACGEKLRTHARERLRSALVFGPERSGLTNHDVALTDAIVTFRVNPEYGSLNLAQAVALLCYEWYREGEETPTASPLNPPAAKEALFGFFEHLEGALEEAGFFRSKEMTEKLTVNIRSMFTRAGFTDQEVRTLRGMVSHLQGKVKRKK
ncbi:MAG: methyltransferase, TrmH family, group 1 [Rickettsiales bacterium]|jgi:tRNA/rRNA methyltransferase|nr:methyltransferase, TrmH family, group 1 [Rickettsiales bacterium]